MIPADIIENSGSPKRCHDRFAGFNSFFESDSDDDDDDDDDDNNNNDDDDKKSTR